MYTEFYNLSALPFQLTPDARFFFGSTNHARALAHLTYGLSQGEGFIIITGDVGAGKTTLLEHLFAELDRNRYVAAKITNTQLGAHDMLSMVAGAFGLGQEGLDKAALLRRIEGFLGGILQQGKRALLIVDECQNLSIEALEELRMLSNIQSGGNTALQSFLLGQPQFRTTLARGELEQLRQRVIVSYHLGPLSEEETRSYVEHRLRTVGWEDDPRLGDGFFPALFSHTDGVPRRINTLCSRVLLFGYLEERHELDAAAVDEVAADLQRELQQILPPDQATGMQGGAAAQNLPAGANPALAAAAAEAALEEFERRLGVLETYVQNHDRTIRRALQLAADYIEAQKA